MTRRWLGSLLRSRQAAEERAQVAVAQARRDSQTARDRVAMRSGELDGRPLMGTGGAMAYSATLAARHALAAELSASVEMSAEADSTVDSSIEDLAAAAARRRAIEKLAEQQEQLRRKAELDAAQRESDDRPAAPPAHKRRRGDVR